MFIPNEYSKGTLQFMALALLEAIQRKEAVEHTPGHDLESIVYLLGYSVLRRLVGSAGCPESLEKFFKNCFGQENVGDIADKRRDRQPLSWWYRDKGERQYISQQTSGIMRALFSDLETAVEAVHREAAANQRQATQALRGRRALGEVR